MDTAKTHKAKGERTKAANAAAEIKIKFVERLKNFRVLDPACGSGNFLYLALKALKDIEFRVNFEAEGLGLPAAFPVVGPECVKGIEINPFAAELARVSVWIGEIQWMRVHNFNASRNPILKPLETIECRDALLNPDGTEAEWPEADVIIGNPPFLGNKKFNRILKSTYVETLKAAYLQKVPSAADLVIYWFEKCREKIVEGACTATGLVGTQAIRRGASRRVLKKIVESCRIFDAWSDEEWTVDGADVRVSLVCFDRGQGSIAKLDGKLVSTISPELVESFEIELPESLEENEDAAFQGTISGGPLEVTGSQARAWIALPSNPNGKKNSEVLRPWRNGDDLTDRTTDTWIIDYPTDFLEVDTALFQHPYTHLKLAFQSENARLKADGKPLLRSGEARSFARWWLPQRARPKLRAAVSGFSRVIATPRVAKFRTFVWLEASVVPDTRVVIIARDDDVSFGILHSKLHEVWSLRFGGRHGVGNDPEYIHTATFETFPFPEGLTPNIKASDYANDPRAIAIAKAAARLNELRENWLNPPDLVKRVPEVVPGYPDRILPVDDMAAAILKNRTPTKLYNERQAGKMAWLDHAHKDLDAAVAAAYGWPADLSDDQILEKLFALNQQRAAKQGSN